MSFIITKRQQELNTGIVKIGALIAREIGKLTEYDEEYLYVESAILTSLSRSISKWLRKQVKTNE